MNKKDTLSLLNYFGMKPEVAIIGIRGYYDAKGDGNNIGVYDDAFVHFVNGDVTIWRGNTDPSTLSRGRATLVTMQVARWRPGIHGLSHPAGPRRYPAFVQASAVTVMRHKQGADTGWFGINRHRGGASGGTSSLGCQTYPTDSWDEAREQVYKALGTSLAEVRKTASGPSFPSVTIERRKIEDLLTLARKGTAATPAPVSPPKPSWSILLPSTTEYKRGRIVGGSLFVPVREFVKALLKIDSGEPVSWDSTGDDDNITVAGKDVGEVMVVETRPGFAESFASATEICDILGFTYTRDTEKRLLIVTVGGKK